MARAGARTPPVSWLVVYTSPPPSRPCCAGWRCAAHGCWASQAGRLIMSTGLRTELHAEPRHAGRGVCCPARVLTLAAACCPSVTVRGSVLYPPGIRPSTSRGCAARRPPTSTSTGPSTPSPSSRWSGASSSPSWTPPTQPSTCPSQWPGTSSSATFAGSMWWTLLEVGAQASLPQPVPPAGVPCVAC